MKKLLLLLLLLTPCYAQSSQGKDDHNLCAPNCDVKQAKKRNVAEPLTTTMLIVGISAVLLYARKRN